MHRAFESPEARVRGLPYGIATGQAGCQSLALSVVVKRLRPRGSSWRTDPSREGRRAVSDRAEGLSGLVESWASAELAGDVGFLRARPGRRGDGVRGDVAHAPGLDPPWRGIGCPGVSAPDGPHADIAHLGPSGERALRARAPRQRRSHAGEPGAPTRRCAPGLPSTRAPAPLRGRRVRARASTFGRGRRRSSRYCPARLMSSGRESESARAWKPSGAMVATGLRPSHCIRWTTTPAGRKKPSERRLPTFSGPSSRAPSSGCQAFQKKPPYCSPGAARLISPERCPPSG
jgi:hypothetical protein